MDSKKFSFDALSLPNANDFPAELTNKLHQARCLILNKDYQPINYLPLSTLEWKDAFVAVFQEKVEVIEVYDDVVIRSINHKFMIPSVVVNKDYVKIKHRVEFCKSHVFLRDQYQCQYCGGHFTSSDLTYDHWTPRAEGGKTNWSNITTACKSCNEKKGTQSTKRWKPRTIPYKPAYEELANKVRKRPIVIPDARWIPYMNWEGKIKVSNWKESYMVE